MDRFGVPVGIALCPGRRAYGRRVSSRAGLFLEAGRVRLDAGVGRRLHPDKLAAALEKYIRDSGLSYERLPSKDVVGFFVWANGKNRGKFPVAIVLADATTVSARLSPRKPTSR